MIKAPVVEPVLQDLRDLYDIKDRMERYHAYVALMTGKTRGEYLPIGSFSPMGERQAAYLDKLVALRAEAEAQEAALRSAVRLPHEKLDVRVILVVVDEPKNGWTQRSLTDADWRFGADVDMQPRSLPAKCDKHWVSVQLWTDVTPTPGYVRQETAAALYRYCHRKKFGIARTLQDMLRQEGKVLAFAGLSPTASGPELAETRQRIAPYLASEDYSVCMAALYGDDAAVAVGYNPLGIGKNMGFQLALHEFSGERHE